jgi:hypothetical protein
MKPQVGDVLPSGHTPDTVRREADDQAAGIGYESQIGRPVREEPVRLNGRVLQAARDRLVERKHRDREPGESGG